ncbi:HAD family hydrolase [Microbacterium sp. X-17]|uniref:HAD family hydrolase n=1 Tax=Microbacterium sp. X-17 TaxID=3144404 RepID=UPI0031F55FC2
MTIRTVLFDVDGTLVDSNYLHIDAWQRAFAELGVPVESWRIHRALGRDSGQLLRAVAGERDEEWDDRAWALHAKHLRELAPRLRAFDGAADLLRAVAGRGVRVVLATSAAEDELTMLRRAIGADDAVHASTSADDVDEAKPDPDILEVALRRADAPAAEALVVGDSVWDMTAAGRARIRSVGVLCGGVGAAELTDAGAREVFEGPTALLEALDRLL